MATQRWRPFIRRVRVPNPAPGVDWSQSANSGAHWLVLGASSTLVTDATAVTRFVSLVARSAEDIWFRSGTPNGQAASTTINWCAHPSGVPRNLAGTDGNFGFPTDGLIMRQGEFIEVQTPGLQAGDQWSNIFLTLWEFPETLPMHIIPGFYTYTSIPEVE